MKTSLTYLALAVSLLAASLHAQVTVPGDFATLQAALDAAPPGAFIYVDGGEHVATVIAKPVTIVGTPDVPLLRTPTSSESFDFFQEPAIELAGPGSGVVTLVNVRTGGTTEGFFFSTAGAAIEGGGFDELRVLHSEILPPTWTTVTGFAVPPKGIDVDVDHLLIEDSLVRGGSGDDDGSALFTIPFGGSAVETTEAVTVLDSEVRGGDALDTVFPGFDCPGSCAVLDEGFGGAGISADVVRQANSIIAGGRGAEISCFTPGVGEVPVCTLPDGPSIVGASAVDVLPGVLLGSGVTPLGGQQTLTWFAESPSVFLIVGFTSIQPTVFGKGVLYVDVGSAFVVPVPGGGLQSLTFTIPFDTALLGVVEVAQVFDPATGATRPVYSSFTE